MKKRGFTLIEIIVVFAVISLVSGVAYRLMTGTFSQFFKSQTKLTNMRAASIILERLKADMRLALLPVDDSEKPEISSNKLIFCIIDDGKRRMVTYEFANDAVTRNVKGGSNRSISKAAVKDFKVVESGEGSSRMLQVTISVDKDKDQEDRSESDKGNQVELRAVLYPRFFTDTISDEEKFWNLARSGAGGN